MNINLDNEQMSMNINCDNEQIFMNINLDNNKIMHPQNKFIFPVPSFS